MPIWNPRQGYLHRNGQRRWNLQIEMRVQNGRGYISADRNFDEGLGIGYIPVDSVHSPLRRLTTSSRLPASAR
jgi:DNA-directed RNA polymerase alpha subunit